MSGDLKIIKKKFGEAMSHFCRDNFSTILETPGLLSNLLLSNFYPSHNLLKDIQNEHYENYFIKYINSFLKKEDKKEEIVTETPEELMKKAGYTLVECQSESDILSFKKYYAPNEELCTFNGGRLKTCRVFFAVKNNVQEIKRENFKKPKREDEYGTSVISIQFLRNESHFLSIKNRYNHKVSNPDATFQNNLDNIIPGLTKAFEQTYGLKQANKSECDFSLPNYVRAKDGKFYKFNYEIDNIYYCVDNIIIENFEVKKYDKSEFLITDYFIINFATKQILCGKKSLYNDAFKDGLSELNLKIVKIIVTNEENEKIVEIFGENNEYIKITLDDENRIRKMFIDNIKALPQDFLRFAQYIKEFKSNSVEVINSGFLRKVEKIDEVILPHVKEVKNYFLSSATKVGNLKLGSLEEVGNGFCLSCEHMSEKPDLSTIKSVRTNFFTNLVGFENGDEFGRFDFLNLVTADLTFLSKYPSMKVVCFPKLKEIRGEFLIGLTYCEEIFMPELEEVEFKFMTQVQGVEELYLPKVYFIGTAFMEENTSLKRAYFPSLRNVSMRFLRDNPGLDLFYAPYLHRNIEDVSKHKKVFISNYQSIKEDDEDIKLVLKKEE